MFPVYKFLRCGSAPATAATTVLKMTYGHTIESQKSDVLIETTKMVAEFSSAAVPTGWAVSATPASKCPLDDFPGTWFEETADSGANQSKRRPAYHINSCNVRLLSVSRRPCRTHPGHDRVAKSAKYGPRRDRPHRWDQPEALIPRPRNSAVRRHGQRRHTLVARLANEDSTRGHGKSELAGYHIPRRMFSARCVVFLA
jgi:hypothetical protein